MSVSLLAPLYRKFQMCINNSRKLNVLMHFVKAMARAVSATIAEVAQVEAHTAAYFLFVMAATD